GQVGVEGRTGRTVRDPGESAGRSRRCERRCPSPPCHWRESGRRRRGSLESEDLPGAPPNLEPLAEGGFVAQRSLALRLVVVLVVVFVLPASALAASVRVRVEGKTQTLFGPTEIPVNATNALDALEQASIVSELYYHVTQTSFGPFVDQVGRYGGAGSSGWVFKVNDASPPIGADKVTLNDGDRGLWYFADFGPTRGPAARSPK